MLQSASRLLVLVGLLPACDGGTSDVASSGAAGTSGAAGGVSYTTDFDLTESALSEQGAWHHDGLDWTVVETSNGVASNTQALGVRRSGPTQYNDSYAYLSGFPADQQASALVHLGDQIKLSVNGVVRASAQDATFADGNPGIGFWRGSSGCGTIGDFGFTHFTASAAK